MAGSQRRRRRAPSARVVPVLALAVAGLAAQREPAVSAGAQAQRLVRCLELPERRTAAWQGLLQLRTAAAPPLALALADPRPDVVVRAAWILGLLGRDAEAALPALQRGAEEKETQVACACRWAIDRVTFRGTLLTDNLENTVVLLDENDAVRRTIGDLRSPWFAEPTGGGNLLVVEFGGNRVRELDGDGKEVWSFTRLLNPYQAQRLPGGTTLICDAGKGRVIEVDAGGQVVWEKSGLHRPVAAERYPDGHTLITEQKPGRVHELDAEGRTLMEVTDLQTPLRAQRLPNGHTLIAVYGGNERGNDGNSVIQVDAAGAKVGSPLPMEKVLMVRRRSDGHTLIASTAFWLELDAGGKEVWRRPGKCAAGIWRQ